MKKMILGFMLFFVLGVVVLVVNDGQISATGVVKQDLLAGQHHKVGEVHVWNDVDTLYVKYLITEGGWRITETHLYAGTFANLPTNRPGNPMIGHFPHKNDHAPAVTEYTYEIPKGHIDNVDEMIVAAHAVVQSYEKAAYTPEITWSRSSEEEVLSYPGKGGQWEYNEAIGQFTDMTTTNVWDNGYYQDHIEPVSGVNYASWLYTGCDLSENNENLYGNRGGSYACCSDLRLFRADFVIPKDVDVTSATLGVVDYNDRIPINDNIYVFVNGELLFWGGTSADHIGTYNGMSGNQAIRSENGKPLETDGWYIPGTFPSITNLRKGENVIEVFTEDYEYFGGMSKLFITVQGGNGGRKETAWGDGDLIVSRGRGNWATYFAYEWQGLSKQKVATVTVQSDGTVADSGYITEDGVNYVLKASGTYRFAPWGDDAGIADAKCSLRIADQIPGGHDYDTSKPQWVDGAHLSENVKHYLQIWVNGNPAGWVEDCNDENKYTTTLIGDGNSISFKIKDDYYDDNDGSLTVEIYKYH